MAWTSRGLLGLSFGLVSLVLAGCGSDDSSSSSGGIPTTTTTGGGDLMGEPIPFADGWAALDQNTVGIQGAFYTFKDDEDSDGDGVVGTSTISPDSFEGTGTQVCATGNAGMVMNGTDGMPAYDDYWGTAIGFNLSQDVGVDTALPYDAAAKGVTGFSFMLAGDNPIPAGGELRFNIKVAGDTNNYCRKVSAAGPVTLKLTDMWQSCWENVATAPTPDPTKLEAIHWQYVTNTTASYDFSLCVTELRALK